MRVPSEPRCLRWDDIDWDSKTITFRAPKTERYEGLEERTIPIFQEIREPLQRMFDVAFIQGQPASEYVLPKLRDLSDSALRKPMLRAIAAAEGQPWSKLFTTRRSTRVTELQRILPSHVVNRMVGHSDDIAEKHYAQVRQKIWRKRLSWTQPKKRCRVLPQRVGKEPNAVQSTAPFPRESGGNDC